MPLSLIRGNRRFGGRHFQTSQTCMLNAPLNSRRPPLSPLTVKHHEGDQHLPPAREPTLISVGMAGMCSLNIKTRVSFSDGHGFHRVFL